MLVSSISQNVFPPDAPQRIPQDRTMLAARKLRRSLIYMMFASCILSAGSLFLSVRFFLQTHIGLRQVDDILTATATAAQGQTNNIENVLEMSLELHRELDINPSDADEPQAATATTTTAAATQGSIPSSLAEVVEEVERDIGMSIQPVIDSIITGSVGVPGNWVALYNGYQYKLVRMQVNYRNAKAACQGDDAEMIDWAAQNLELRRILWQRLNIAARGFWVGCTTVAGESFAWDNGIACHPSTAILHPQQQFTAQRGRCGYIGPTFLMHLDACARATRDAVCERRVRRPS